MRPPGPVPASPDPAAVAAVSAGPRVVAVAVPVEAVAEVAAAVVADGRFLGLCRN